MKIAIKPALAIAALILFTACNVNVKAVTGSGEITSENRNLSGFTGIKVSSGMEVNLIQSDAFEVVVEADDNVQQHVVTKVENGILIVASDYNSFTDVTMKVNVKMPVIKGIETNGGATVNAKNVMVGENVVVQADGGSTIKLNIESEKISATASGGATIDILGKALAFDATAESGSTIDAENLIANDVVATAGSGSSIEVHPAVSLKAKAAGGASVNYKGNPTNVLVDEGSGGSVSKQ